MQLPYSDVLGPIVTVPYKLQFFTMKLVLETMPISISIVVGHMTTDARQWLQQIANILVPQVRSHSSLKLYNEDVYINTISKSFQMTRK